MMKLNLRMSCFLMEFAILQKIYQFRTDIRHNSSHNPRNLSNFLDASNLTANNILQQFHQCILNKFTQFSAKEG